MSSETATMILDGMDQLSRARNLNRMLDIASRDTAGPGDDAHAFAALAEAIELRLAAATEGFEQALRASRGKGVND